MREKRQASRRGSMVVEFALGSVLFFIALFGVMDWAWFFFHHQTLLWRASDAARFAAATRIDDPQAVRNIVLCGTTTCEGSYTGFFDGATVDVQHVITSDKVDDITPALTRYYAQVTVSNYTLRMFTPFVGRNFTGRPIVVAQPMECIQPQGNCWVP